MRDGFGLNFCLLDFPSVNLGQNGFRAFCSHQGNLLRCQFVDFVCFVFDLRSNNQGGVGKTIFDFFEDVEAVVMLFENTGETAFTAGGNGVFLND